MRNIFLILSAIFFILSWVIYPYNSIMPNFLPELCAFISALFFISSSFNEKLKTIKVINYFFVLSLIPIFQYLFDQIIYFQNFLFTFIYIFTFSYVVLNSSNQPCLFSKFIYLLIISSIFNSIVSIFQILDFEENFYFILELNGSRVYGNLGQPNNLSTLIILAFIGSIYLYQTDKLNKKSISFITLITILMISLTQSRTGFLNLILFFILLLINHNKLNIKIKKLTIYVNIISFFSFFKFTNDIFYFLTNILNINTIKNIRNIETNIINDGRIDIWMRSLELISENPIFGIGFNQNSISNLNSLNIEGLTGWFSSSHNIIIDIILWCGLIIGSLITYLFIHILLKYKNTNNLEAIFSYFMILCIIFHSLLELPLHYAYFLFTLAFLFGILLSPETKKSKKNINTNTIKLSLIFGFILIPTINIEYLNSIDDQIKANYLELERTLNREKSYIPTTTYIPTKTPLTLDLIAEQNNWISLDPRTTINKEKIYKYKALVYNQPTPSNLFKLAQVYHYNNYINDRDRILSIINIIYKKNYTQNELGIKN